MKSGVEKVEKEMNTKANILSTIKGKWSVKPCRKTWLHTINPNHDGADIFSGAQIWKIGRAHV